MSEQLLDAVNGCLSGIGEFPVDNLYVSHSDAALALNTINRTRRQILSRGWWFNKEENWRIPVDQNSGNVFAPDRALSVLSMPDNRYRQLTLRSGSVYDVDAHTFDLRSIADNDGYIKLGFIVDIDFEDLPPTAQHAIALVSKRVYAQDMEVVQARWNFQVRDEEQAMAGLYREDGRNAKKNQYKDSKLWNHFQSNVMRRGTRPF
ncbi:MAG: hypothetical protein ACRCTP_04865 [Aeromonas popoffii]|uniref:hypothetical protein n=1 Tax=Aeromonas popoffii TaxID=70856 RepID=UPI003F3F8E6F